MLKATSLNLPLIVVIDVLNKCENENDVWGVLQLFTGAKNIGRGQLRIFVTSRPETPICLDFNDISENHCDFVLYNVSSSVINKDILIFIQHELNTLGFSKSWLSESDMSHLV